MARGCGFLSGAASKGKYVGRKTLGLGTAFGKKGVTRLRAQLSPASIWKAMCSYTTVKQMTITNPKIGLTHKFLMLCVIGYIAYTLTFHHGYMKVRSIQFFFTHRPVSTFDRVPFQLTDELFLYGTALKFEKPLNSVTSFVEDTNWATEQAAYAASPPWYCDNAATDFTYSAAYAYTNNGCDTTTVLGDVLVKGDSAKYITTYYRDVPANVTEATAAGLYAENNFIPGVENVYVSFNHVLETSWGHSEANAKFTIAGVTFAKGETVKIKLRCAPFKLLFIHPFWTLFVSTFDRVLFRLRPKNHHPPRSDLLTYAGMNLDSKHANNDVYYRLSGLHVMIEMKYSNVQSSFANLFNHEYYCDAKLVSVENKFNSLGPKMVYRKDYNTNFLHKFERYPQTIRLSFVNAGEVGIFDMFTLGLEIAVALGLIAVADVVVDNFSNLFIDNFYDIKYDTSNDWLTTESLKQHALETGILDRFAEEVGAKIISEKSIAKLREAMLKRERDDLYRNAMEVIRGGAGEDDEESAGGGADARVPDSAFVRASVSPAASGAATTRR